MIVIVMMMMSLFVPIIDRCLFPYDDDDDDGDDGDYGDDDDDDGDDDECNLPTTPKKMLQLLLPT